MVGAGKLGSRARTGTPPGFVALRDATRMAAARPEPDLDLEGDGGLATRLACRRGSGTPRLRGKTGMAPSRARGVSWLWLPKGVDVPLYALSSCPGASTTLAAHRTIRRRPLDSE